MGKAKKITSWVTLGANLGVLVGLILLVVELDQNSDLVRAQIHQARSDNFEAFRVSMADTEQLLPAMVKFKAAGGPRDVSAIQQLDPIERERIRRYYAARLAGYDNLHFQYKNGFLDEDFYNIRVVNPVRLLTPLWSELGLISLGSKNPRVTTSFAAEIERIQSSD
ncbi:MAG: hypothetical protein OER97_10780 [Gammaproteobacteria bacterium]|nr:hypothetical protein [Gammaproteobacteria bacterium]